MPNSLSIPDIKLWPVLKAFGKFMVLFDQLNTPKE